MNRDEIKQILLIYRPGTSDADDPEVAEALALAQRDQELSQWLEEHNARQKALQEKFRQLSVPLGLKEQIISEQAARKRAASKREKFIGVAAVAVIVVALISVGVTLWPRSGPAPTPLPNTLVNYQAQMVEAAKTGYYMQLSTNVEEVHAYLAQHQSPTNYVLPPGLQNAALAGCAVQSWQDSAASMICFRSGRPLPPGQQSDLWFFVIDQSDVKDASNVTALQFAQVNGLITATWAHNGKLYMLATHGDEQTIQKFL